MFEMKGKVVMVGATIQISEKFSKREFVVLDESGLYPQSIMFQLSKDKCELGDALSVGDSVSVSFNLNGREWTNPQGEVKYFNTLDAWKIVKHGANAVGNAQGQGFEPKPMASPVVESDDDSSLPF